MSWAICHLFRPVIVYNNNQVFLVSNKLRRLEIKSYEPKNGQNKSEKEGRKRSEIKNQIKKEKDNKTVRKIQIRNK
jgi:hypothetical protein